MKTCVSSALVAAILVAVPCLCGAEAPKGAASLHVTVTDISETRNRGTVPGDCRLYLALTGDAAADAFSVHRIRVTAATDELGRNLTKHDEEMPESTAASIRTSPIEEQKRLEAVAAEVARRRVLRESATAGMAVSASPVSTLPYSSYRTSRPVIALRNPSRQSGSIKLIEGEIDLFNPTEANGGLLRLKGLSEKPGQVIAIESLAASGIQWIYFTRAAFDKQGILLGAEAKKILANAFTVHGPDGVLISIRDPNNSVVELELMGANGKRIPANLVYGAAGWNRGLFVKTPPPADAQLVLRVAVPGAIKTYPFKLENIPLP